MFPGAGANIYRNEAGEPTGWDYPADRYGDEEPDWDEQDYWANYQDDEPDNDDVDICDTCGREFHWGGPESGKTAAKETAEYDAHVKTCTGPTD